MKNRKSAIAADMAYMAQFILLFACMAFLVFSESKAYNVAALCILFAIIMITHFTTVTLGLILNMVIIFAGFTWYLYRAATLGEPMQQEFTVWAIVGPVLTVASHLAFRRMAELEEENESLSKRVQHFSVIDDVTELKNIQAYEMEFPIYQRISARYEIGLMLVLWQFRYADDLMRMLGKGSMQETAVELSRAMSTVFRQEDVVYIISKSPYEWGSLLLSREDSEDMLKERIKQKMARLDLTEILGKNAPKLEVRVGVYYTRGDNETALSMLEKAKNSLQYDV